MKKAFLLIGVLALALGITYLVFIKAIPTIIKAEEKDAPLDHQFKILSF